MVPHCHFKLTSNRGFTLVELSIVLVIVGLLIGGILVGQSLISSARVNKLVMEVKQYKVLAELFKERFRQYPGDFNRALSTLGGCNNVDGSSCNGNGDGIVVRTGTPNSGRVEDIMFWHHLYMAGFLKKPYGVTYTGGGALIPIGEIVPKLSYHPKAGLKISHDIETSTYFAIGANIENYYQYPWLRPGIVIPADAAAFDNKIDDGIPNTGNVRTHNPSTSDGFEALCFQYGSPPRGNSDQTASTYDLAHKEYVGGCSVRIKFDDLRL